MKHQRLKITTIRSEYNKLRKDYLESIGKINCSRCGYHNGENDTNKYYGTIIKKHKNEIRYPNWKLVSKNKKQYIKKNKMIIKKETNKFFNDTISIYF